MLQALSISTYCWKDTSYDSILLIINRLILEGHIDGLRNWSVISTNWNGTSHNSNRIACSTNWKDINYNLILAIVNGLMKMVYYKPVQIPIDAPRLPNSIVSN